MSLAFILTLYIQASDNSFETKTMLFRDNRLCQEQGAELVDLALTTKSKSGKTVRSAWFNCAPVRGKAPSRGVAG
ncbi:hypothetical protein [Aureimonas endophytica]|uniref:hypothetical protein n=1 Tax=Aureimonas endophytica TaxID=2027858 RepID=UPI0016666E20|nr:hypothetical protein [Aureimonas endophytica]